jgi:hypothetical protein
LLAGEVTGVVPSAATLVAACQKRRAALESVDP